jgi:hypothetical protein
MGGMHAHFLLGMPSNRPLLAGVTLCSSMCCKLLLSCDIESILTFHRKRYADLHCKSQSSWLISGWRAHCDGIGTFEPPQVRFQQTNAQFQTNIFTDLLIMVIPLPIIIRAKLALKCVVFSSISHKAGVTVYEIANASTEPKSNSVSCFLLEFL